ncbi:MAG: YihY/virulence factor BrkB family protein [Bacilli bacterium]
MKTRLKSFLMRLYRNICRPEMRILPGQLAFFFVLSLIPLIALIGAIAGQFSISTEAIEQALQNSVPKEVIALIFPVVANKSIGVNMIIFYISAFILASNGTHSMIIASNSLYKVADKDYISRRIKAIVMTIILVLLLVFVLIVPAFGNTIISFITSIVKDTRLINALNIFYQIAKYPLSLVLIFFNIKLLYTMAPDTDIRSRDTTYGAIFTTVGWIISTEVYSLYANQFAKYNLFYGGISNILILMLWVYILAYIFVLGMALNTSGESKDKINL